MKRFSIISLLLVICSVYSFAQKDVMISGGDYVTALVGGDNSVWVVGQNRIQEGTGILGVGSSSEYITSWQRVNFPGTVTIQQVSSGAHHFAALDCEGKVLCWGLNTYGRCGQDTVSSKIVSSPSQVSSGVLAGTEYDEDGYLTNVAVVSAGTCNTFAILGQGRYEGMVVAWGGNINESYVSSLGDGTTTNRTSPVWCVDLNGNKVKNIVQVFASDDAAMLLDEDGHVWTAGGGRYPSTLGRKATGGYAATASTTGSSKFGMVYVAENEPLSDIVQIAAGGVNCQALDKDGYVWGWGDVWNSACGIGSDVSSSFPMKVIAGLLEDDDTDGTYLLAKSIRAGQSCGYAVSKTNKPVMWGQYSGLSIGTSVLPRYIEYASGKKHDDVISIDQGKLFAFYRRSDGTLYALGDNSYGQLAIGNTTNQTLARPLNPPSNSSFKDPYPTASLSPSEITACSASAFEGVTLDCGFMVSTNLLDSYSVTWYKDGVQVQTGNASQYTYTTPMGENGIGAYKVVVKYIGTNNGCYEYEDAEDEITISALQQEFSIPSLTYCGDEATVNVTPSNSTAEYTWYANQSATAVLGKSIGDEEITIDISGVSALQGNKTIYVKETSNGAGSLIPGTKAKRTQSSTAINQSFPSLGVTVSEPTTFLSTSLYLLPVLQGEFSQGSTKYDTQEEALAQTQTLTGEVTITLKLCGTTSQNGKFIENTSDVKKTITKTLPYTYDVQASSAQPSFNLETQTTTFSPVWNGSNTSLPIELVEIPIDTTLGSGVYYFVVSGSGSGKMSKNDTKLYTYNGSLVDSVDNMNGAVSIYGASKYNNYTSSESGPLFDFKLKSNVGYCAVVPVTVPQACPITTELIFDDCTDGDTLSNIGGYWFTYTDASEQNSACTPGITSTVSPFGDGTNYFDAAPAPEIMNASGHDGTGRAVHVTYTIGTNYVQYNGNQCASWTNPAYVGIGARVGEEFSNTVDWSAGSGISFWYKGPVSRFCVATSDVEDTNNHGYIVPECAEWTKITVKWSDLEQESWGTRVDFSPQKIQCLLWYVNTEYVSARSTGEIWIDDIHVTNMPIVDLASVTISPISDEVLAQNHLHANVNPLQIPVASGAAGDTLYLGTTLNPVDATYSIMEWSSSDESIASVDSKGRVIGVSEGSATITACSKMYPAIKATYSVTVKNPCTTPNAPVVEDATYCYGDAPEELSAMASYEGTLMWYEATTEDDLVTITKRQDVLGGSTSMHGSSYTFDNGVQTMSQLGAVATNVVFCFKTIDENLNTLDAFRFISGTEATNEIVRTQASETKFVMISDATQEEFENVDWSEGTTSIDIAKTLEAGQKSVAFKNALSEGFFEVVSYDEDTDDLNINVWTVKYAEPYVEISASTTAPWPNTTEVGKTTYYVSQIVNGCESEKTPITVTVNELPSVSISVDKDEVCAGETITLTADADDSGTFTWSGDGVTENGNTATVTAMPTTPESITITLNYVSEYNCEAQASATVTFLPVPTAPTAEDVAYCQNETAEMLTATASEGATLLWYESEKSAVASTKAPVPSTATVGDTAFYVSQILNGCESARTEIIATVNSVQTVGIAVDKDEVCVGETVSLMAMPLNGLSYEWFGNGAEIDEHSSGITITPTETMSINLKFTGENGCESEASATITVKAIPEKPIAQSVSYCQNAVAQILTAITDGEQKWYIGDEASTTAPVPNTATVGDTTYYVSQIVNGCESEKTAIKVTVSELPSVGITANKTEICAGETVTLTANAEDGDFAWSDGVTSTEKTVSFAPTETTSVSVTFTNESGCESEASTTITVNAIPEKPVAQSVSYCQNAEAQILTAIADGKLKWYIGDEASATAPVPSTAAVGETTYYVSQIVNGCESEKTAITVTVNENPSVTITADKDAICSGETATLTASVIGDESGSFEWSNGDTEASTTITSNTFGAYTVTVTFTSEHSCTSEASATVTVNPIPTTPVTENVSYCQNEVGQILTATASEGAQLLWYESETGGVSNTTAPVPSTSEVGETKYYVSQVVDGCESGKTAISVTVNENPSVTITADKNAICSGETATLTASVSGDGSGTFAWSNGGTGTTTTITPDETETVTVTYATEQGCTSQASATVEVRPIPEMPIVEPVSYFQNAEAEQLTAIADGELQWYETANGGTPSATAPTPNTEEVGETTYYVSQIVNGCESEKAAITVSVKSVPVVPIAEIPDVAVDEEGQVTTIELSDYFAGGESEEIVYTVTSSDPSIVYPVTRGDELEFVQYGSGTVTITVTATAGTTVTSQTFTITVNPKPDQPTKPCELSVLPEITNVTCFGGEDGKIEISVSGGAEPYQYKWNTGRTSKGIYASAAGEYSVLVRDSLGCTTTSTFTIEEPAEIVVTENITNPSCGNSNGAISIMVEGGTAPYTQRWYSGNGTALESLENLQGDIYEVVVVDKNSCKLRKTYALQESGAPSVTLKSANASKCNDATGNCEIEISGGEPSYTIVWSDSTEVWNDMNRPALLPGTYTVTVNDAANCRSVLSVTIPSATFKQPEIALVTVGQESEKNLVIWQKPETDVIDHYTVWREGDEDGKYDKLGDVDFHETSIFVDEDADILSQSWRYKLSATDVCGNESPMSKEHKTLFLQKNLGLSGEVNLIWDSYEGIQYASYNVYRITRSSSELELIKKVPARLNMYTDMNPPADIKGYYVAIVLPEEIDENAPLKAESGPFALAISNIAEMENKDEDAISEISGLSAVVYAKERNIIVENQQVSDVVVYDIAGKIVAQKESVKDITIPVKNVGVYVVQVGNKACKVVVE